uniref:HDC15743 n=1 Tax=Drosophila melanogaster TaxID=7227 RepID=Q6IJ76_DROME|nr:TPA_inf: HDC15743 [Drosophila melanogaster]
MQMQGKCCISPDNCQRQQAEPAASSQAASCQESGALAHIKQHAVHLRRRLRWPTDHPTSGQTTNGTANKSSVPKKACLPSKWWPSGELLLSCKFKATKNGNK